MSRTALVATNPKVQQLRRLVRRRSSRSDAGAFVVEGPVAIGEALRSGAEVDDIFLPVDGPAALLDPLRDEAERLGIRVTAVAAGVLGGVADTVTPQPGMAVVRMAESTVDELGADAGLLVVLAGVSDPGNAGTLVRTAEAAGAVGIVALTGSVDLYSPKVVRAAAGSLLRVAVLTGATPADLDALRAGGVALVGTSADGDVVDDVDLEGPLALVLGSEAHGIGDDVRGRIDRWASIPMAGRVESLNVAVAGSVLAFEVSRRARRAAAIASGAPSAMP